MTAVIQATNGNTGIPTMVDMNAHRIQATNITASE